MRKALQSLIGALALAAPQAAAETGEACPNVPPDGDAEAFYEIVETAVTTEQLMEMVSGLGDIGMLADGSGRDSYDLPSGSTVPAAIGTQPLVYKPMEALPMPDNPGLLDELASGGVHTDGYNSSTSPLPGPRGVNPLTKTTAVHDEETRACTPLLRDNDGYLASVCISLFTQSELVLFDPSNDFAILAQTGIPERSAMIDPAGGWYTRMDHLGRPLLPTATQELRAYKAVETEGVFEWTIDEQWDLSETLPEGISATDVIPDFDGDYWFITGFAHVGHIDTETGEIRAIWLDTNGEELIGAAFAVGPEGAYVLTSKAMYMLEIDDCGDPSVVWRWEYGDLENPDLSTPTLFDEGRLVAFSINYAEGNSELVIMQTSAEDLSEEERGVCRMDMFEPGKSAIQNTTMGYGRSVVAQNNYGGAFYEVGDFEPGLARVDVSEDYSSCELVWEDDTISSQVPPRLSTGDGHVWLYSHRRGEPEDVHAYYLTALDFETGEVVSEIFVASGKRMDNPMLSVDFLPGGVMVGGVRNGIMSVCDSALDETGTPVCTEISLEEEEEGSTEETEETGCGGCAAAPADRPIVLVWMLLGLAYLRRTRSSDVP